jgi:FkbM family methyltransferase
MRLAIARIFRYLFKFHFFRKRYYGIVFHIFQPLQLFKGITEVTRYDAVLKVNLSLDEWIQQQIYFLGYFDPRGIRYLKNHLYEGEIFIDIGANVGSYSLVASSLVGRTGRVYAFEPAGNVFERLTENIAMNGLKNIIAEKKAILDKNGSVDIYLSRHDNLGMSSIFHHSSESGVSERVETISLDDYAEMKGLQRISLIKIDIEGAEMLALRGMRKVIEKFRPRILIELKEETVAGSEYQVKDIIDFLINAAYEIFIINEQGNITNELNQQSKDYFNFLFLPVNS